jgi:EAL domain-containing protein (putative c-di-GMP-specific phosphodiesterase class I)
MADVLVDGLARAIGVDVTIGQWTLATALAAAAEWQERAPGVGVRVTVPGQSLLAPGFPDALRGELTGLGLASHLLTVLIREAELASDDGRLAPVIRRLRRAGVQVGLAEFGHGYMTLAAIRRIRPVGVELDGGLLADHSEAGAAGLEWALNEARALGLDAWPPPGPVVSGDELLVGE